MRRSHRVILSMALAFSVSGTARAEDDAALVERGKTLYDEAVKLLDAKKYAEACPKLEESVKLVPVAVGARLALGECEEGRGRLATALTVYREAQPLAAAAGQADREALAKSRIASLLTRVATVEIAIPPAEAGLDSLAVELDGKKLVADERKAPIPVNSGKHAVRASAVGRTTFDKAIDIKDGDKVKVDVTLPLPGAAPSGTSPDVSASPSATAPSGGTSPLRIAGIVGGVLGIGALAAGGAMGAVAIGKKNDSTTNECPADGKGCTGKAASLRLEAIDAANASTGLFIAGGVLLAAGVVLFVVAPSRSLAKPAGAEASLLLSPNGFMVKGSFQ